MKEYLAQKLNDEQLQAAIYTETSSLILAGAGSGKTRTLTYKIAFMMTEHKVRPENILAVTFTNKAANEMKERLVNIIESLPAQYTANMPRIRPRNLKWIGTFHGIFLKILKEDIEILDWGYTKNFVIYDTSESMSVIKQIIKDKNFTGLFEPKEAKGFISKTKSQGLDYTMFGSHVKNDYDHAMATLYREYQKQLIQANAVDFDDLLLLPYLLCKNSAETLVKRQKQFAYIMVDEAQDTNRIQFELMKMLGGKDANITFIGDDFQSIYGWRGALMENFLNLKDYWSDIVMFKLQTNYRSRPHIVQAGSAIIKKNTNQYEKDIKAHRTGEDNIVIFSHPDDMHEALNIIEFIARLQVNKQKKRSDFSILYRTNAQSGPFERVLVQEGIPYKIFGAYKFFERKEIKDIIAYLKFLLNPKDNIALQRIINTPSRKLGKTTVERIMSYGNERGMSMYETILGLESYPISIGGGAKNALYTFGKSIFARQQLLETTDPARMIERIIKDIDYKQHLIKEDGKETGEERYENIGQLINMAEKYATQDTSSDEMDDTNTETNRSIFMSGADALRSFMEEVTLMTDIATEDPDQVDAIKLMTIHSSKGLEFPYVFIVGCEENIFPLGKSHLDPRELEEERRLMYVALTRAEDHVFLSWAKSRMQWGRMQTNPASRFLKELPQDLLKSYDLGGGSTSHTHNTGPDVDVGDWVKHKLFGTGEILEIWNGVCIVRFENPKFGVRKIETRLLSI